MVDEILSDKSKLKDLYDCYLSSDEVVRLRVSNGVKRVCKEHPDWVAEYLDGLLGEVTQIDQPSTKWTLAILYMWLDDYMSDAQRIQAIEVLKHNIQTEKDWIVLNNTAEALTYYAKKDDDLKPWVVDELKKLLKDSHKSVVRRAEKFLKELS